MKWTDEQVKKFAAECIWETYGKTDCRYVVNKFFETYQDKPDESPESSVWPGEEEINEFDSWLFNNGFTNAMRRIMIATLKEWYPQWLQSRTAVKAEESYKIDPEVASLITHHPRNPDGTFMNNEQYAKAANSGEPTRDRTAKDDDDLLIANLYSRIAWKDSQIEKLTKQSQPTAGGVKEEGMSYHEKRSLELEDARDSLRHQRVRDIERLKEKDSEIQSLKSEIAQLKSSNPSIKDEAKEDLWKMLDIMNDFCMSNIDGYGGSAQQYRTEAYLNKYKSAIFTYTNPSIKWPTEEEIDEELKMEWNTDYRCGFKVAIDWLLSIQPDKL